MIIDYSMNMRAGRRGEARKDDDEPREVRGSILILVREMIEETNELGDDDELGGIGRLVFERSW